MPQANNWVEKEFARLRASRFEAFSPMGYSPIELAELAEFCASKLNGRTDEPAAYTYFLANYACEVPISQKALREYVMSGDADSRASWLALGGAARSGAGEIAEFLGDLIYDSDANTQVCAIDALPKIGSAASRFVSRLKDVATDETTARRVQYFARRSLEQIGRPLESPFLASNISVRDISRLYRFSEDYEIDALFLELRVQQLLLNQADRDLTPVCDTRLFTEVIYDQVVESAKYFLWAKRGVRAADAHEASMEFLSQFLVELIEKPKRDEAINPIEDRDDLRRWVRNRLMEHLKRLFCKKNGDIAFDKIELLFPAKCQRCLNDKLPIELNDLLDRLPNNLRRIVELYDLRGYNHQEIAKLEGFSREKSRRLRLEALNHLRDAVQDVD